MNYQVFSYIPSAAPVGASTAPAASNGVLDAPPRPIRVTPSALSALVYALLYSIEFQSPVGPRPPTLREHAGQRGAAHGGSNTGAAAPIAATFLTSAVSVMSSFWGRSPATMKISSEQQVVQRTQSPSSQHGNSFRMVGGTSAAVLSGSFDSTPGAAGRLLTHSELAELAALQRQHEQPFVVPVTQVLHKLGGVHITVRETHNPTIATAYNRAMEEVEAIFLEHEQRLARLPSPNTISSPRQVVKKLSSASTSATMLIKTGSLDSGAAGPISGKESTGDQLGSSGRGAALQLPVPHSMPRNVDHLQGPLPPTSPTSPRSGRPASSWSKEMALGSCNGGETYTPGRDEVGLMLSVRLLSREASRWRQANERPLAEWRFPIIRTADECMVRPCAQSLSTGAGMDIRGDGAVDLVMVNDPAQVLRMLEFILKSSYQTTSMETFTDFTSGELVFDAHVTERHRFI